jgi:putative ABC transport system permease protein
MSPLELLRFAGRALAGHRARTLLSLLGMAIGVASVVALTALGEGARRYVMDQFASIGSNVLVVVPGKTETTGLPGLAPGARDLTLADALAVAREVPGVVRVAPIVRGTESVAYGGRRRQVAIIGASRDFMELLRMRVARGEPLPAEDLRQGRAVAILGAKTAAELFAGEEPLGRVVRIGGSRMRVIGIMAKKGQTMGVDVDDLALVPVASAMRMLDRRSLARLMVEVPSHTGLEAARGRVRRLLAARHREEDVTLLTHDAVVATFSSILTALTLALGAIAAVSLAVAGIGIMNVMLVAVSERTREVGLMRALGVGRGQVLAAFLAEATLLSAAGGGLGLAVGWSAVRLLVRIYPDFPAAPPGWAVAAALGTALGVGCLFGLLPARRAAALDPVQALSGH